MAQEESTNEAVKSIDADAARALLADYLASNPESEVDDTAIEGVTVAQVRKPWGDPSVSLLLKGDVTDLAEALNAVVLPPRLSAVWHKDTKSLEVIWTAYNLPKTQEEIGGRKFDFQFEGKHLNCEFGDASARLMAIAKHSTPSGITETNHRNLYSFAMLAQGSVKSSDGTAPKPRSFWIKNVDYDEESTIQMIRNLNFYLTYYDNLSPYVVIHEQYPNKVTASKSRYLKGSYPSVVTSGPLDENLLSFWESAQSGTSFMKFLLHFRIIEYAAYHYVEEGARGSIRKILRVPDLHGNVPSAVDAIVSTLSSTQKLHDSQRIRLIIKTCVSPDVLWPDVYGNLDFFSKPTEFDGGFSVGSIVSSKDTVETWGGHRLEAVADAFRKIRNALSHGKDMETTGVIRPTSRNINLFGPWVHLISVAAGEVVLYKDVA